MQRSTRFASVMLLLSLVGCSPRATVDIHGRDYAFTAPATVSPGVTTFRFINDGAVLHEVQLFRFHPGLTADSAAKLLAAGPLPLAAYDISGSVLITAPGTTAQ